MYSNSALFAHLIFLLGSMIGTLPQTFSTHQVLSILMSSHPDFYESLIEDFGGTKKSIVSLHTRIAKEMRNFPEIAKVADDTHSLNRFGAYSQCGIWEKRGVPEEDGNDDSVHSDTPEVEDPEVPDIE